jgi:RNA-directed DNA polymerase
MMNSARAAKRVMYSMISFVENRLKLTVNRTKSRAGLLRESTFLGFTISRAGKLVWTRKALERFRLRIRTITSRSRGVKVTDMLKELKHCVVGWLNYFGLSHTYGVVLKLGKWMRRRVRMYYGKQWKQPRTRRRKLLALGACPETTKLVTRSRKGYWRLASNSPATGGMQKALSNEWLIAQGVPAMKARWIARHYGNSPQAEAP